MKKSAKYANHLRIEKSEINLNWSTVKGKEQSGIVCNKKCCHKDINIGKVKFQITVSVLKKYQYKYLNKNFSFYFNIF